MLPWYMYLYRWRAWYIPDTEIYMFFLTNLDGSASILRPKQSMHFLHSIIFTVKMGSRFSFFDATRLAVSKTDPSVIVLSRNIYEMIPLLSPNILYHHIFPLSRLRKQSACTLWTSWHPGYNEKNSICGPLLTWHT